MPKIAVVGSANMDLVVRCDALPRPGETVVGHGFSRFPGGKGANQAVAAGRSGGEVFFVGCVGDDQHGDALVESLTSSGVDVSFVSRVAGAATGTALITVDSLGENTIVVDPGANSQLSSAHVSSSLQKLSPDVVLVQLEIPDDAVYACAGFDRLLLDPAPARLLDHSFLESVDVATPNASEILSLTGIAPVDEFAQRRAAHALLEMGVRSVALTLGADGVFYFDGRREARVPAPVVEVVDTTAAGDAFAGALAVGLASGASTDEALELAVRCASQSVTRHGAQASMPSRDELEN